MGEFTKMTEFLGWSTVKPTEDGLYWWKPRMGVEDSKAIKVSKDAKDRGLWKPVSVIPRLSMQECSFCDASVLHIGDAEIEAGWGRIEVNIPTTQLTLNHCPKHSKKFVEAVEKWANEHGRGSTRKRQ